MDNDIVKWLRAEADDRVENWSLMAGAADEIERLRAAGDQLADYVREAGPGLHDDMAVLACWQEARRG